MSEDAAWCAKIAEQYHVPQPTVEECLRRLYGDRLLLKNVMATAAMVEVSPLAVVDAILERRG